MNQEAVLAVLPDSRDDAKSLKEIANEMGLDITAYEMGPGGSGAQAERRGPAVLV